jgi:hypothetical protein
MIRLVRQIVVTWLFLVATVALAAGCGTDSPAPNGSVTKVQAAAYAKAVNLRQGDLPPTRPGLPLLTVFVPRSGSGVFFCGHGTAATNRAPPAYSPAIEGGGVVAISGVRVMLSKLVAAIEVAALTVEHRHMCGEAPSRQQVGGPLPLRIGVPAAHPALGARTISAVPRRAVRGEPQTRFYSDTFVFAVGPAEIALIVSSVQKPPPTAFERHLVSLLYSRAEAHKL